MAVRICLKEIIWDVLWILVIFFLFWAAALKGTLLHRLLYYKEYGRTFICFFVRDGILSVADYNSTRVGVVVVVVVVIVVVVVVSLFCNGIT